MLLDFLSYLLFFDLIADILEQYPLYKNRIVVGTFHDEIGEYLEKEHRDNIIKSYTAKEITEKSKSKESSYGKNSGQDGV